MGGALAGSLQVRAGLGGGGHVHPSPPKFALPAAVWHPSGSFAISKGGYFQQPKGMRGKVLTTPCHDSVLLSAWKPPSRQSPSDPTGQPGRTLSASRRICTPCQPPSTLTEEPVGCLPSQCAHPSPPSICPPNSDARHRWGLSRQSGAGGGVRFQQATCLPPAPCPLPPTPTHSSSPSRSVAFCNKEPVTSLGEGWTSRLHRILIWGSLGC